jgi:hypothetical protein
MQIRLKGRREREKHQGCAVKDGGTKGDHRQEWRRSGEPDSQIGEKRQRTKVVGSIGASDAEGERSREGEGEGEGERREERSSFEETRKWF